MSGIDALLGGLAIGAASDKGGAPLWLGTVTSVGATTVQVVLDGADTAVSATNGNAAATINDRVIVTKIGRSLYVLVNLTTA